MKRLINLTTCLSMALYIVPPFAVQAQDVKAVTIDGKEVICLPNKKAVCPDGAFCVVAKVAANCEANAVKALAEAAAGTTATPQADADAAAKAAADQAAADKAAADQAAADKAAAEQAKADKAAAKKAAAEQATADKDAADKAAADRAAANQAAADKAATDKAAADQANADQAAADKAAADKAAADQAAADQANADKAAAQHAAADKAAADKASADKAATDQAAADQAAADKAATDKAATDQAATDQAAADKASADKSATDQAAADQAAADKAAADKAVANAPAAAPAYKTVMIEQQEVVCLPAKTDVCPDGAVCVLAINPKNCTRNATKMLADLAAQGGTPTPQPALPTPPDAATVAQQTADDAKSIAAAQAAQAAAIAAAAADPNLKPVEAPVPTQGAVTTLETVLDAPADPNAPATQAPAADAAAAAADPNTPPPVQTGDQQTQPGTTVTTETVTAQDTRSSTQDFAAAPVTVAPGKKSHLSTLETVGLVALGALVVGAIINGNKQVVQNTGDRVVVRQPDGTYQVYKDDNALLREPGSTVRTETFNDGSTRSIVQRTDGSQIVTIRDASGRVLQRVAYDKTGHGTILIDDLQPEQPVVVSHLPKPQPGRQISVDNSDAALRAQLAAADAADIGRKFSLRQIRTIAEVRYLAPTIDVNSITFETGSAAIQPTEARKLNKLGHFIAQLIAEHPGEVFLIEGHTDAVGSAASNLALSDRRAESVAKALTEYFQVPPENLVVQGYGESELKIPTLGDERLNRRVAVRIITSLLRQNAI